MSTPALGQPVEFVTTLERRRVPGTRPWTGRREWRKQNAWITTGIKTPVPGIVTGVRTLSNGAVQYSEDGTQYTSDKDGHFTAWVVTYDLRRKPVLVLPEHILTTES